MPAPRPIADRAREKYVETEGGCWEWIAAKTPAGYGQIGLRNSVLYAHRVLYELHKGPIADDLELDHLCRNRACVNPDHLEPVTHRENILRGESPFAKHAAKTHCKNGHEFTPENTYITTTGRACRQCHRNSDRRYALRKKRERHEA